MAKVSRDTLKGWFETGDKPTQQQFINFFDSFVHKDDEIEVDLDAILASLNLKLDISVFDAFEQGQLVAYDADSIYNIGDASLLEKIVPYYGVAGTMKLSTVQMGDEDEMPEIDIAAGWNRPIEVNILAVNALDLYIAGIPNGSKIIFIKRKLKLNP